LNIQDSWEKALKHTEVVRPRVLPLETAMTTKLPYIFLSESLVNPGDTVVRKGEVFVEKPAIILPFNLPQFEGFEFEEGMRINEDFLKSFFLVRGITFPSLKYNHKTSSLDLYEGRLDKAIEFYGNWLKRQENVSTGLVIGAEDVWQFSVLIFICGQVVRSADGDIKKLLDDLKHRGNLS
jgi:hypothetical protein